MPDLPLDTSAGDFKGRALVVDAMAVLQSMKKTPTIRTLADLKEAFVRRIENMLNGFNEGRIIFDRYLDQSLKNKTRQKRAVTSTEFEIHPEMKLQHNIHVGRYVFHPLTRTSSFYVLILSLVVY